VPWTFVIDLKPSLVSEQTTRPTLRHPAPHPYITIPSPTVLDINDIAYPDNPNVRPSLIFLTSSINNAAMPLVVPGITSNSGSGSNDPTSEWTNKLLGKKLSDSTTDTVVWLPSHSTTLRTQLKAGYRVSPKPNCPKKRG
jgi:hypothetical protein